MMVFWARNSKEKRGPRDIVRCEVTLNTIAVSPRLLVLPVRNLCRGKGTMVVTSGNKARLKLKKERTTAPNRIALSPLALHGFLL